MEKQQQDGAPINAFGTAKGLNNVRAKPTGQQRHNTCTLFEQMNK
jgi:hypothetical protein